MENTLEREQEALVNRLWKKLERLETEKKHLQTKINEKYVLYACSTVNQRTFRHASGSHVDQASRETTPRPVVKNDNTEKVESHVKHLKREVDRLRKQLFQSTHESRCSATRSNH